MKMLEIGIGQLWITRGTIEVFPCYRNKVIPAIDTLARHIMMELLEQNAVFLILGGVDESNPINYGTINYKKYLQILYQERVYEIDRVWFEYERVSLIQ